MGGVITPYEKYSYQNAFFFYFKFMLQNGGCNRKSTLLDLKDDDDFVLKFIPVNIRL